MKLFASIALIFSLTSCEALKDFDFSGQAAYVFEDGSKARIVGGPEGGKVDYWKKVGDSWLNFGTVIKANPEEIKAEK